MTHAWQAKVVDENDHLGVRVHRENGVIGEIDLRHLVCESKKNAVLRYLIFLHMHGIGAATIYADIFGDVAVKQLQLLA